MRKERLNHIERIQAALSGSEVDRLPYSFWYHFGTQHLTFEAVAEAHVRFYRTYDQDFIKVMHDYPYPLPPGLEVLETTGHWGRLRPLQGDAGEWSQQLRALETIGRQVGNDVLFVDTVFSPWTVACHLARKSGVEKLRREAPSVLEEGLSIIARSLAAYARRAVEAGASGIFYSISGADDDVMPADEYRRWGRPRDLEVLRAVAEAPFNILHIHGRHIHFDSVADYPTAAINWSCTHTGPGLAEGRHLSGKCVMGGLDEEAMTHLPPPDAAQLIQETTAATAGRSVIVTPGCAVPTNTEVRTLKAIGAICRHSRWKPAEKPR